MSSGLYQIRDKNLDTTLDLTRLKPYGDTMTDGKVQTSCTLPVKDDAQGAAAAWPTPTWPCARSWTRTSPSTWSTAP